MVKPKSLKVTRWTRFRAFLRGLLLYNTVYWRRASDGVNREASRVGRVEREKRRPRVDPELLRPRLRPGSESQPELVGTGAIIPPEIPVTRLTLPAVRDDRSDGYPPPAAAGEERPGTAIPPRRKRRVKHRRKLLDKVVDPAGRLRSQANAKPKRLLPGWLRWLLGWHH